MPAEATLALQIVNIFLIQATTHKPLFVLIIKPSKESFGASLTF
jgi:hypothetical protein